MRNNDALVQAKFQIIIPNLAAGKSCKEITGILRNAFPTKKISDDYARRIKKLWEGAGRTNDPNLLYAKYQEWNSARHRAGAKTDSNTAATSDKILPPESKLTPTALENLFLQIAIGFEIIAKSIRSVIDIYEEVE